jgi:zinc protease
LVYGRDSIYARVPTKAQISSVTRADMAAYLARWQCPDAALLGVVGDFEVRRGRRGWGPSGAISQFGAAKAM